MRFLLLLLFLSSCFNENWKEFKNNLSQSAVIFVYSSASDELKEIKDKKLNKELTKKTKFYLDINEYPAAKRRLSKNTPALCFVDSAGINLYTMHPIEIDKISMVFDSINTKENTISIEKIKNKIIKSINTNPFLPGEERAITELALQKIKKSSHDDIPLSVLSNLYLESQDKKIKEMLTSKLTSELTIQDIDPIAGGLLTKDKKNKKLKDFSAYALNIMNASKIAQIYALETKTLITKSFNYLKERLKRKLYYSGLTLSTPYNLLFTEKEISKELGPEEFQKTSELFDITYKQMKKGERFIVFSNKLNTSEAPQYLIDKIKNNESLTTKKRFSIDSILALRLEIELTDYKDISEIINSKTAIDKVFLAKNGLIKTYRESFYLENQIEYLNLILSMYKTTGEQKYLDEANIFFKKLIKMFCTEHGKNLVCSDLSIKELKQNIGIFGIPDYSIDLNSKLVLSILDLSNYTNNDKLIEVSYRVLSSFKSQAQKMIKNSEFSSIENYINALVKLYLNPVNIYIIINKPNQINEYSLKQEIYKNYYPYISLKTVKDTKVFAEEHPFLKVEEKNNQIFLCINTDCKTLKNNKNISKEINDFIDSNKEKLIRLLPYFI